MPASAARIPVWLKPGILRARRALSRETGLAAAYLYGSALGRRDFEDVDVALLYASGARTPGQSRLSGLALSLDKAFQAETDLHAADELPDALRFRVVRDGVRFLTLDRLAAVRFESETLIRFLDFKPAYDRLNASVLARRC